jgi:hypothetical protein
METVNYRFDINDHVAHIENIGQKMVVKEIKRRTVFQSTGEADEVLGGFKKVPKNKIDGILVYWFEGSETGKIYKEEKFHSELLVPWNIALQGKDAVNEWVDNKQKLKIK